MGYVFTVFAPGLISMILLGATGVAQARQTGSFDPLDFSGYWIRNGPRPNDAPPKTAEGEAMMVGRHPDYLVDNPSESNDPMYKCNPQGFPRLMWEENEPIEIIHLPGRILTLFQWERQLREIWTDGRALPTGENLENIGPNWYGHSVGHWEGNTLVVNTTGFNELAWMNEYGDPLSFEARVEERFTRIDENTIEGHLAIYDPKFYTEPWIYKVPQMFKRMRPEDTEFFGWKGLFSGVTDAICAPMVVEEDYNKRIQNPAIFGTEGQ